MTGPFLFILENQPTYFKYHGFNQIETIIFPIAVVSIPPLLLAVIINLISKLSSSMANTFNNLIIMSLIVNFVNNLLLKQFKSANIYVSFIFLTILFGVSYVILRKYLSLQNVKFSNKLSFILMPLLILIFFNFLQISKNLNPNYNYSPIKFKKSNISVSIILFDGFSLNQVLDKNAQIDRIHFPGLYKLSQLATFYINGTSNSGATEYSVPSIMSGMYPNFYSETKIKDNSIAKENNFFSIFANTHNISAKEEVTNYCASFKCLDISMKQKTNNYNRNLIVEDTLTVFLWSFLPKSLSEKYLPRIDNSWGNYRNREILDQNNNFRNRFSDFEDYLNKDKKFNKPTFTYLHVMMPHEPYVYLPDGKQLSTKSLYISETNSVFKPQARQRYRMQLLFTDQMLGRLADKIKNDLNDQMVIILSDHGESLYTKENSRGKSMNNLLSVNDIGSVMSVPIFIHYPNQSNPKIDQTPIQLVDILPIVSDYLGISGSSKLKVDGLSLDEINPDRKLWWFLNGETRFSSKDLEHNFVAKKNSDLFDLKNSKEFYMYSYGPYKDLIGSSINNLIIQENNGDRKSFLNENEITNFDLSNNVFSAQFLIYSDNVSRMLKNNLEVVKYYAVTSGDVIASITQAIPVSSLRDSGQALDFRVDAILNPSIFNRNSNQIEIYEIIDYNTLKSID